jgi:hypothetical protein
MLRKIRDLDFDQIVASIVAATDPKTRRCAHPTLQPNFTHIKSTADAVALLRDQLLVAVLRHAKTLDDIKFEDPIVQGLIRAQHHPLATALPEVGVKGGESGPNVAPLLTEIAAAHSELAWDLDAVKALIIREIRSYGDHEVDDAVPPGRMYWLPASSAASALIVLLALQAFGDLK